MMRRTLLLALLLAVQAPALSAQIPTHDTKRTTAWIGNVITRIGDAYVVVKKWRDEVMERASWVTAQADMLVSQRKMWERRAYGELGGLGKELPDWREYANFCEYKVAAGYSACGLERVAARKFNRVANRAIRDFRTTLLDSALQSATALRTEIASVIVTPMNDLETHVFAGAEGYNDAFTNFYSGRIRRAQRVLGLAEQATVLVDSVKTKEELENAVSSGRSHQIAAEMSLIEADIDLELTREYVYYVQQQAMSTIQAVADHRRTMGGVHWKVAQ